MWYKNIGIVRLIYKDVEMAKRRYTCRGQRDKIIREWLLFYEGNFLKFEISIIPDID
jgi:hypothetical protein